MHVVTQVRTRVAHFSVPAGVGAPVPSAPGSMGAQPGQPVSANSTIHLCMPRRTLDYSDQLYLVAPCRVPCRRRLDLVACLDMHLPQA